MSLDDKKISFDFNAAVETARREYPQETRDVIFVDLSAPDAEDILTDWYENVDMLTFMYSRARANVTRVDELVEKQMQKNGFVLHDWQQTLFAMSSRPEERGGYDDKLLLPGEYPAKLAAYIFYHELGHIVVKDLGESEHVSENIADTFAAMQGLSKGFLTPADIEEVSVNRALNLWRGNHGIDRDFVHITSASLDALILGLEDTDFVSLLPQEIKAIARKHAESCAPDRDASWQALKTFQPLQPEKDEDGQDSPQRRQRLVTTLKALGDICLQAKADSYEFFVSARILNEVFKKGGIEHPLVQTFDTSGAYWDGVRKAIAEKTPVEGKKPGLQPFRPKP